MRDKARLRVQIMSDGKQINTTPAQWQEWLLTNIRRNCSDASMADAMQRAGISKSQAQAWILSARATPAQLEKELLTSPAVLPSAKEQYQYEESRLKTDNTLTLEDRSIHVSLRMRKPELAVLDEFLHADECEALIKLAQGKLAPSTTVDPGSGDTMSIPERTSEGAFFQLGETALISSIEQRIAELLQWPVENGEGLQVLHYREGGEYRPHFDYFPPEQTGSAKHLALGGQRIATLIMYLNEVQNGGATIFPRANLSLYPRRGTVIYFSYCNANGEVDPETLHGGAPVLAGEKWIATKWLRQRRYVSAV